MKGLEKDRLKLILDSLRRDNDLSTEVKRQIEKLTNEYQIIDKDVAQELTEALQLFQIGQTSL